MYNYLILLFGRLSPAGGLLLLLFISNRFMESEEYAKLSGGIIITVASALAVYGWITQSVTRYIPTLTTRTEEVRWRTFSVQAWTLQTGVVALVVVGVAMWGASHVAVSLAGSVFFGAHHLIVMTYLAQRRWMQAAVSEIARGVFSLTFPLAYFYVHGDAAGAAGALFWFVLGVAATPLLIGGLNILRDGVGALGLSGRFDLELAKQAVSYGAPIALWTALLSGHPVIERTVAGRYLDAAAIGEYAYFYDIAVKSMTALAAPIIYIRQPTLFREFSISGWSSRFSSELSLTMLWVALLGVFLSGALYMGMSAIGDLAAGAAAPFVALCVAGTLWQLSLVAHKPLEAFRRSRLMVIVLIGAIAIGTVVGISLMGDALTLTTLALTNVAAAGIYIIVVFTASYRIRSSSGAGAR